MNKIRYAALAALMVCAPTAYLHAATPAEGDVSAEAPALKATKAAKDAKAKKPKAPPLAQLLKNADANGDQKLDLAEIHGKLPKFPETRFATLDKNKDGFLDASEMPKGPKADANGAAHSAMHAKLKAADTDQDGKLSQAEYTAGFPNAPVEHFAKLDRNSDGFVDQRDRDSADTPAPEKKMKKGDVKKKAGKIPADSAAYVTKLLAKHDADKDGKLTKAELETAKPGFPENNFAELDRNKDGVLSASDAAPSTN